MNADDVGHHVMQLSTTGSASDVDFTSADALENTTSSPVNGSFSTAAGNHGLYETLFHAFPHPMFPILTNGSGSGLLMTSTDVEVGDIEYGMNSTSVTAVYSATETYFTLLQTILLGLLAGTISLVTVTGNLIVIASFILERAIRQPTNYFIASLAVSDLLIGSISMPLYTVYLLSGKYWPLGEVLCDLWLSLDYTVCLVSIYTVFCITIDRFCSVKIPAKYRNWRTERKVLTVVCITWMVPIIVFFTSINGWQFFVGRRTVPPGMCYVQYMEDAIFNALLQFGYFWITLAVMCSLYAGIYRVALRLQRKSEAKQRKMASLMAAGNAMSKIGIGVTQQPSGASSGRQQIGGIVGKVGGGADQRTQQQQRPSPGAISNGCHGDISAGGGSREKTRACGKKSSICVGQPMSRSAADSCSDRRGKRSKAAARWTQVPMIQKSPDIDEDDNRSSSSVALSSDSDCEGRLRSAGRRQTSTMQTNDKRSESYAASAAETRLSPPAGRTRLYGGSTASPVDVVERAVRYVAARRHLETTGIYGVSSDIEQRRQHHVERRRERGQRGEGGCAVDIRYPPCNDSLTLSINMKQHPLTSVEVPVLPVAGGMDNRCSRTDFDVDQPCDWSTCRRSVSGRTVWQCLPPSVELRGQPTSPVWVRRALSQGRLDDRRSTTSAGAGDCATSGFGCDWATCRGGISIIHRRHFNDRNFYNSDCSFALRRARTVELPRNCGGNEDASFDDVTGGHFSLGCNQMQYDFGDRRSRLRVPETPVDLLQPSCWHHYSDDVTATRQNGGRNRCHRVKRASAAENHRETTRQPKRKSRHRSSGDNMDDNDDDGANAASASGRHIELRRKTGFLAAAAEAVHRRMIGINSSLQLTESRRRRFARHGRSAGNDAGGATAANAGDGVARGRASTLPSSKTENRALKALRTITIILGAFVVCFTPWHVLSLIIGFCSPGDMCVSVVLYDISYWLCYLNSPLNPFCYAFANQQFKKAFLRIIRLDWHRT